MADLQKLEIARWLDKIARLENELEVYRTVVLPALRAVWKHWSDINHTDPNAEGYDTIELIRGAIEAIGAETTTTESQGEVDE